MRTMVVNTGLLAALLACAGPALAQKAKPVDPRAQPVSRGLAELITEALKNNPDIRVAEAKLSEAGAILNRTRLQVTQKIVAFYYARDSQKAQVVAAEAEVKRMTDFANKKVITLELVDVARQKLLVAKAKLAEIEAELPYLLGKQPLQKGGATAELQRALYAYQMALAQQQWSNDQIRQTRRPANQSFRGSIADKLRKALDTPVTLKREADNTSLGILFERLEDLVPGITFRILSGKNDIKGATIDLHFTQAIPLGALLQAVADSVPDLRFAVREYGVLVTWKEQLPPDAILLHDFWKNAGKEAVKAVDPFKAGPTGKNPPHKDVQGKITKIDSASGLVEISIGSDTGVAKGNTLEVIRLDPENKKNFYLGTIRILEVTPTKAVGKPLTPSAKKLQKGDTVVSRIKKR